MLVLSKDTLFIVHMFIDVNVLTPTDKNIGYDLISTCL